MSEKRVCHRCGYVGRVDARYCAHCGHALVPGRVRLTRSVDHILSNLIVVHNRPSGHPTPSPEDGILTEEIVEGSQLLDIEALEHLIVGRGRFVSLKERGLGFE